MSHIDYADFSRIAPDARAAMLALGKATKESGLDPALVELVFLRVSQINGCAFCLQLHVTQARAIGLDGPRLDLVAAWRDAGVYSPAEMAALDWAEQLTRLSQSPPGEEAFAALRAHFSERECVYLSSAIATINAWNRFAVGFRFAPMLPA